MTTSRCMCFNKFVFKPGLNITVRRGIKWSGLSGLISVKQTDVSVEYGMIGGIIKSTHIMRFCDIPKTWLHIEHDPDCRTRAGLLRGMRETYDDFIEEEIVTVVTFEILEKEQSDE